MNQSPEQLTARESLDIITAMISAAKGNVKHNAFYFLLWGWVVMLANLGMYILAQIGFERPYVVWAITIPAWIISLYRGFKQDRSSQARSHLDSISGYLWVVFGVCIFTVVAFGYKLNFQLNPLILVISAIPTFISGVIIRFRPLMFGGVIFWIGGIIGFLTPFNYQPLVGAFTILFGYLVPGYILKKRSGDV